MSELEVNLIEHLDGKSYIFKSTRVKGIGYAQIKGNIGYICLPVKNWQPDIWSFRVIKRRSSIYPEYEEGSSEIIDIKKLLKYHISLKRGDFDIDFSNFIERNDEGIYYPRMNRNNIDFYSIVRNSKNFYDEIRSFYNIYISLEEIFNFVEPSIQNFNSYSHKIRELLILACTEVEYLLLKFLKDNGYSDKKMYRTTDYFYTKDILKLDKYSVTLNLHQGLGNFNPFNDWDVNSPTKSINWYDAYNSVKHDRGGNFSRATLENLINSVAAIHIILEAQYGTDIFKELKSEFRSIFYTNESPLWNIDEVFIPKFEKEENCSWTTPKKYFEDNPV